MATEDLDLAETMSILSDATLRTELESLYGDVEDVKAHLQKLKPPQLSVLAMNYKSITEIKSFVNPPEAVKDVMHATFLLLGHEESDVENWTKLKKQMGKQGTLRLKIQVATFDHSNVKLKNLKMAKKILEKYDLERIKNVSAGAATIYIWATNVIHETDGQQSTATEQTEDK